MYLPNKEVKAICAATEAYQCWIPNCTDARQSYKSIMMLKKHLKDSHHRVLCDICVDNRALMLNEQKLYRPDELKKHIWQGDFDEDGNMIFMHPYCDFCDKHFFSEDQFTLHLRDHFKCDLCTEAHQHRYYKSYDNLAVHFSISHYGCPEEKCVQEGFVAFKTMDELTHHRDKVHREANVSKGAKTKVSLQCTDFKFEGGG